MLTTEDPKIRREVANFAVDNGLSVRETEKALKRLASGMRAKPLGIRNVDANVKAAEVKLQRALSTNVKILPGKKGVGGKIEIEYYSVDDLDRIYEIILNK